MSEPLLRFAPSPNGRLHLGHAYSALLNDRVARDLGGRWLLRMEDIDPVRATAANIRGVLDDLDWLGLRWPEPVRFQSEHMEEYGAAADRLRGAARLHPCSCSRGDGAGAVAAREATGEVWPRDPDGSPLYPGTCRAAPAGPVSGLIAAGERCQWRLDMDAASRVAGPLGWTRFGLDGREEAVAARPERWGDAVLVRKDVPTSYHLSVVADDARQGISHVVRGRDLEAATDLHALLAALLGLAPPRYHHHALLLDADGLKLAKSRDSRSLRAMRDAGETAGAIRLRLGFT